MKKIIRAGACAIVGPANAGKSTFLNAALGQKIAIATHVAQTTRHRILGVLDRDDVQIAFYDTPGLHQHRGELNRRLMRATNESLAAVDAVLLIVDASRKGPLFHAGIEQVLHQVRERELRCVLALNKIDRVAKPKLLPLLAQAHEHFPFAALVPMSAQKNDGVDLVVAEIAKLMPTGDALYDDEVVTDQTERDICAELLREQLLLKTRQEVPHSVAVTIERFDESRRSENPPLVEIDAIVWVERDGQKAIVIGEGGSALKAIGRAARLEMERLLDSRVMLRIEAAVASDWSNDPRQLDRLGYGLS